MSHRFVSSTRPYLLLSCTALLTFAAQAQTSGTYQNNATSTKPATGYNNKTTDTEYNNKVAQAIQPEQMLQSDPSAAGIQRPLSRAEVQRDLKRARSTGELEPYDRESTSYSR